jgi:Kdo2-lipid IVA lauroyltransferase/acyltransferase
MALTKMAALIGHLPVSGLEKIGRGFGHLAYWLDIRHRRIVSQNIAFIYPEWNSRQRRRLAKQVFQHFGIIVLEILQAPYLSRKKLVERVSVEGQDILLNAMNHPRGCLVFSAHLGNWEIGLLALSARLNRSTMTVAKPIKWKLAHNWLTALRSRFGNQVFFKEGAMPWMIRALREGRTLSILIDQGVRRKEAVEVTFFGKQTLATPAAALLALRCRMPVVPIFCLRSSRGNYHLKILPPVTYQRTASLRHDIQAYTQMIMGMLEDAIRNDPEQWFWFHRRWKRTYPELYPEYQALRRRKRKKKGLRE